MYKGKRKSKSFVSSTPFLPDESTNLNSSKGKLKRALTTSLNENISDKISQIHNEDTIPSSSAKKSRLAAAAKTRQIKPFATTYFEDLLEKSGLTFNEETEKYSLKCEPIVFLKNLKTTLENNVDFPRNVSEFIKGFRNVTKEPEQFKIFFLKNVTVVRDDPFESHAIEDNILRLFMNVSCLQESLIDYLLEKATEYAIEDKTTDIQMILKPFQYLDNISNSEKLIKGLLELLDVAGHLTRLEVITCIPDIVAHLEHQNIALELSKFLSEDFELTPAILDCLSYLCLPPDLKTQVQDQMLTILRTSAPMHFFPNMVNFFLMGTVIENEIDVIRGLRDGLDWTVVGSSLAVDISSSQVMTVMSLRSAITKSKNLANSWLKVINQVKVEDDHKPLDIVMLLVLYATATAREKIVDGIFRKRIKAFLFNCDLLNVTFTKMKPVLKEYLNEMLKIASSLLKCKTEPSVVEFAAHWFSLMFKELDSQKTVISELLNREYSGDHETLSNSLNILTKIAAEDISILKPHSLQILVLIDMLENLSIDEVHQVMDLLCGLAFGVTNSCLKDDIHMLILKQLSSSQLAIQSKGIVGGIMAVKHMVCSKKSPDATLDDEETYSELSDLPDGPPKEAANIVELISKSTSKYPEMICLFYDELAIVLSSSENIDLKFLSWLSEAVTNDFQTNFVVDVDDNVQKNIDGVPISVQFCLNTTEEAESQIALNIANLTMDGNGDTCDIKILSSLFRITQLIHSKQNNGDLSSIDALLGCGVLMPMVDIEEGLDEFETDSHANILDCYVHCINWFRELINAFCSQDQTYLRKRVIERLNALVILEKHLAGFIKILNFDYKLPICCYASGNKNKAPIIKEVKAKKLAKGSRSKKKNQTADNDNSILPPTLKSQPNLQSQVANTQGTQHLSSSTSTKCKLNVNLFRALDFDTVVLFQEDLHLEDDGGNGLVTPNSNFNLNSLSLILEEINPKLAIKIPSKIKKKTFLSKPTETIHSHIKPIHLITMCFDILPRFCHYMEKIAENIQASLDAHGGVRDAVGLFSGKNAEAQFCLSTLFSTLTIMFSWSGFQIQDNITQLKEGLRIIACRRDSQNVKKTTLRDLVSEACIYSLRYKDWCLLISTAVSLVNFFKALSAISSDRNINQKLVYLSLDMLSLSWCDVCGVPEKGLIFNQNIDILLSAYFTNPDVEMVKSIALELSEQVSRLATKNQCLETYQCISKINFPLLFRATYGALYNAIKIELEKGLSDKQHLELWKNVAGTMKSLTEILKIHENRSNLLSFLKKSIPLFRLFLSQGMPMIELKLRNEPDTVVEILRMFQHSTRFLHSLHCHSRLIKDTAFSAYLPQMKLTLETLVYKVKAALTSNNCSEAFWMGNLKNKNLKGELIASQSSVQTESEGDEEEDQLPEDENSLSSEDDMVQASSKSVSNAF